MLTMREYERGTGRSRNYATVTIKEIATAAPWHPEQIRRMINKETRRTPQYKNYVLLNAWDPTEYHLTEAGLIIFRGILEGFIDPERLETIGARLTITNAGELLKRDLSTVERLNEFTRLALLRRLNGLTFMV